MKIGIIGSGNIGGTLARLFTHAGHEITLANSRGAQSLADFVRELGPQAHAAGTDDAARFGEVVILALPWRTPEALPRVESVAGKIVVDAMNPYGPDGKALDLGTSTSAEETAKRLPGARLVKAFNTIWFKHLAANGRSDLPPDERHAIFVAGDDDEAKGIVARLIDDIGFVAVDSGSLSDGGRRQQPDGPLYNKTMNGREARIAVG